MAGFRQNVLLGRMIPARKTTDHFAFKSFYLLARSIAKFDQQLLIQRFPVLCLAPFVELGN